MTRRDAEVAHTYIIYIYIYIYIYTHAGSVSEFIDASARG